MTTIIAPKYQHDVISKMLLKDKLVLTNTSLLPLTAFINETIAMEENNYEKLLTEKLLEISQDLSVLSSYVNNDTFIKSIKDFHIDMYLYNIKVCDLNNKSVKDQDLEIIFNNIYNLIPNEIIIFNKLKEYLSNNVLIDTYITKQNFTNNYQKEVYKLLKDNGALDFNEDDFTLNQVNLYYANNKRSEVEASAQMIVNKKLINATVIALNSDYLPLVEQVYNRYNINFNLIKPTTNNNFFINFISVIKLIEDPSKVNVSKFLSSNPFDLENITSLIKLNDFFDFDLKTLLIYEYRALDDTIVHTSNLEHYEKLGKEASIPITKLNDILKDIGNYENKSELVESVFNYFLQLKENNNLRNIRSLLMNNKELFNTQDNIGPILDDLLLKSQNNLVDVDSVVVVETLNHYYFNKENVIILGATSNNYPIINRKAGVIDEIYLEALDYPSKEQRYEAQLLQQEEVLKGENINIFYPLSSYDGKGIEPSFTLVDFAKLKGSKPDRYPLIENDAFEFKSYKLREDLAEKLFFKDGMLKGSISAFEQYNNCNYAYFLKHGLKLYPQQLPELSYGYIGSIIHEVMEDVVDNLIVDKEPLKDINLKALIGKLTTSLETLHPNNPKIKIVKSLLVRQLSDVLNHMIDIEDDTFFKPVATEEQFSYIINNNIKLNGFVDRSDQYLDSLRVIDFKSSPQNLSATGFKQGLQLQLITYLLVMSEKSNLIPAGAFYHTMRIQNTNIEAAAKVGKSKDYFYPLLKEDIECQYLQQNRMSGWHFSEAKDFYNTNNYVSGLMIKKSGLGVHGGPNNFETVSIILHKVYQDIYDNLKAGIIDCKPVNNPCVYCEYHSICLSKKTVNNKAQIYKDQALNKEIENEVK